MPKHKRNIPVHNQFGMTDPGGVTDPGASKLIAELQENVRAVQASINSADDGTSINDLARLQDALNAQAIRIAELESSVSSTDRVSANEDTDKEMESVPFLPDIPSSGALYVFWQSGGASTGDDQIWGVYAGQTEFTPTQFTTILSGVPT